MKKNYDVIVIGGGIIGCGLAFELAKRKAGRILLLEKRYLTAGATGRCNAGFREFWSTPLYIELSRASVEIFEHLNAYTGYPYGCEVVQNGYFFPVYREEELEKYRDIIRFQNGQGVPVCVITKQEAGRLLPEMNTEGIKAVIWSRNDGNVNPFHSTFAYGLGAVRMGAEILTETEVTDFIVENQKVKGVMTHAGIFEAERIYNCTNTGAPELAAKAGDVLPIRKELRQTIVTEKFRHLGKDGEILPMIIDMDDGNWMKQSPCGSLMMGKAENHVFEGTALDWNFMEEAAALNARLIPAIRQAKIIRQYEGVYDVSPDYSPFIWESVNAEGLVHVCGFSGHGLMIAPKFCDLLADYHRGNHTDMDISVFLADRFERGEELFDSLAI